MRSSIRNLVAVAVMLTLFSTLSLAKTKRHATTPSSKAAVHPKTGHSSSSKHRRSAKVRRGAWKRHGQQSIQSDRVVSIQQALIREKYLEGEPSGKWDDRTQHAMAKYQADHQWQSKVTPDSRALIKLGLGPDHTTEGSGLTGSADAVASTSSATRGTPNR